MGPTKKFYLPQLDGLRFFAFFLVFIHHFNPLATYLNSKSASNWISTTIKSFGWIGVDVFLCLSSFLLTTLLILEHQTTGQIKIKKFFIRRALRIWPLYYLIMVLAFVIFPMRGLLSPALHTEIYNIFLKQHLLPFSLFLGNFSYFYFTNSLTVVIGPLWTVSLEEQFYLFWPILLFILLPKDKKWFFIALTSMVVLSILFRLYIIKNAIPYPAIWVLTLGRLDPFALGALVAYFYLKPDHSSHPLIAIILALMLLKLVVCSTPIGSPNTVWQLFFVDTASALIIYAAIFSRKLGMILSTHPLPWLGKISFGLYIFHDLMIHLTYGYTLPFLSNYVSVPQSSIFYWLIAFILTLSATILCASVSYYCYEKPFLKLKNQFTIINSRPA